MTREVHPNDMVIHLWANQRQPAARTSNGNVWFDGVTLYSYRTPIATLTDDGEGHTVALVTSSGYSITTSAHIGRAQSAARHHEVFVVPSLCVYGGRLSRDGTPGDAVNHEANLEHLTRLYSDTVAKQRRARSFNSWHVSALQRAADRATRYASLFGLTLEALDPAGDAADIEARVTARGNTPAALRRAAQAAERQQVADRLRAADDAERLAAWRAGVVGVGSFHVPASLGALLRVKGDTLETSMGAKVPLADAIKVFRAVSACRDAGRTWHRNGETLPVGQFQVDHINADGSFRAGCHLILWAEVEAAAIAAGVLEAPTVAS